MQVDIRVVMFITRIVIFINFAVILIIAIVIIVIVVIFMFTAQAQPKEQELPSQLLVSRVFQPHQGDLHICNHHDPMKSRIDFIRPLTNHWMEFIVCTAFPIEIYRKQFYLQN